MRVTHGRFLSALIAVDPYLEEELLDQGAEEVIFQGDHLPPGVHIMTRGIVAVTATTVQGTDVLLSFRGAGGLVGEPYGVKGSEQMTVARAITGIVETVMFTERLFQHYLQEHPLMWAALAREWEERLAATEGRLCSVATENADRRLARFLLAFQAQQRDYDDQALQLSKAVLASWVGVARETVERILKNWRKRSFIETGYRELVVLNPGALARIAGLSDPVAGKLYEQQSGFFSPRTAAANSSA